VQLRSILSSRRAISIMIENAAYERSLGGGSGGGFGGGSGGGGGGGFGGGSGGGGGGGGGGGFGGGSGGGGGGGGGVQGGGAGGVGGHVSGRRHGDYLEPKSLYLDESELIYKNYDPPYESADRAPSRTSWNTIWNG
jgi:hypothetical protein